VCATASDKVRFCQYEVHQTPDDQFKTTQAVYSSQHSDDFVQIYDRNVFQKQETDLMVEDLNETRQAIEDPE
jgi:hypothetical protein